MRGYEEADVKALVDKYYKREDFESHIPKDGGNVYLSVPSTTGGNWIPYFFGERLAKDFGGEVVEGGILFQPIASAEAKNKRSFLKKLEDPSFFKSINQDLIRLLRGGRRIIVVDDTFTTGETLLGFNLALGGCGVRAWMALTLGKLGKEAEIAPQSEIDELSRRISELAGVALSAVSKDANTVLAGGSERLIRKAKKELANRVSAERFRGLLSVRAREIRCAYGKRGGGKRRACGNGDKKTFGI